MLQIELLQPSHNEQLALSVQKISLCSENQSLFWFRKLSFFAVSFFFSPLIQRISDFIQVEINSFHKLGKIFQSDFLSFNQAKRCTILQMQVIIYFKCISLKRLIWSPVTCYYQEIKDSVNLSSIKTRPILQSSLQSTYLLYIYFFWMNNPHIFY